MGIPRYFRYIINNFKELLNVVPNINIKPHHLYFDMNCIIHPSIQFIINEYPLLVKEYNDLEKNDKKFHMDPKIVTSFEQTFYEYLGIQLDNIIKSVSPTKTIYFAIDGVAPRAKMEQQRIRRYRSVKENLLKKDIINLDDKPTWDRNAITPGTIFMYKLSLWLKKTYLKELKKKNKKIKLILDDVSVLGEGEHKIFDWMRQNIDNDIHCIYGLDADLIMLSLCNPLNIYLLRETPQFNNEDINTEYCYFNINKFKEQIIEYFMNMLRNELDNNEDNTIENEDSDKSRQLILYNYVFLCFLFGNDFLPKFIGLDLNNDNIEYVIKKYVHQYSIIKKHIVDENGYMNQFAIRQLFLTLYGDEEIKINNYFKNTINKLINYRIPYKADNVFSNIDYYPCNEHSQNRFIYDEFLNNNILHSWMDNYYKYYFNIKDINKNKIFIYNLCNNYIEGLQWVTSYYIIGCPSYKWYYMYRATPCLRELCNFLKDRFHYPEYDKGNYTPLEQLAMVIPVNSNILLPKSYVNEMSGDILKKWYPLDFKLDTLFKIQLHECNPLLMNIDDKDIIDVYNKLENGKKLCKFDKLRNELGTILVI